jgi:polyferredoxin
MSTLCPNCSRPSRKGAQYCGFCGTNLKSPGRVELTAAVALSEKELSNIASKPQKQTKTKKKDAGRTAAIIAIIILFLIIFLALLGQYWAEVLTYLGSSLPILSVG